MRLERLFAGAHTGPVNDMEKAAVQALFADWVEAEKTAIWEISSDISADVGTLIETARARAVALGIEFDEALAPEYLDD